MTYKGHIQNGVVVLDEPAELKEGMSVRVEILPDISTQADYMALRGTPYTYIDPFEPAVPESDWEVLR